MSFSLQIRVILRTAFVLKVDMVWARKANQTLMDRFIDLFNSMPITKDFMKAEFFPIDFL